jgi:GH25 family lysozyme M1 (1,4-beta-N-acetylmuramidase)
MVAQFVDVSGAQGAIDFSVYTAWAKQWDGISRIAMKATEGVGFTDPFFPSNRAKALAAGIESILYYHFGRPDLGNTPQAEVDYMHSIVGAIRPADRIVLDYEVTSPLATAQWAYQWLQRQEQNYDGKLLRLYSYDAYIRARLQDSRLAKYPLWLANWQYSADSRPACPPPWKTYSWLQYTNHATTIPGIAAVVDCNIALEEITKGGDSMLTIEAAANYFEQVSSDVWRCKQNGYLLGHGMLNFYRQFGGSGLCGLTHLGLPLMNEVTIPGVPGATLQRFERSVLIYDPDHKMDHPPGTGSVYCAHLYNGIGIDPRLSDALNQIKSLQQQLAQNQNSPDLVARLTQIHDLSTI